MRTHRNSNTENLKETHQLNNDRPNLRQPGLQVFISFILFIPVGCVPFSIGCAVLASDLSSDIYLSRVSFDFLFLPSKAASDEAQLLSGLNFCLSTSFSNAHVDFANSEHSQYFLFASCHTVAVCTTLLSSDHLFTWLSTP